MKLLFTSLVFLHLSAFAQMGASTSPFFVVSPKGTKDAVSNGRYQIKKGAPTGLAQEPKREIKRRPANQPTPEIKNVEKPVEKVETQITEVQTKEEDSVPQEPTVVEQAQSLLNADSEKVLSFYKEQIHPDDIRNNRLEIQGSPILVYNGSTSNYSYRSYSSFFTGMDLSSNVWMTPSLGLSGRILFSFGASLAGDRNTNSTVPAKYEDLDLGLKFRRFFGLSRNANSIEFNAAYSEFKLKTPGDNLYRASLVSSGVGLKLISRIPTSASYAWTLGGHFFPRLQHREESTGISIKSGGAGESTRLGLNFGSEVKFSRESQIIYDLGISTERNSFDGTASPMDPESGTTPSNVSVTNTFVSFSLGYRWGR